MHMQLACYLASNTLMATTQYGYRCSHSTELASLELVDRIYGHLENNAIPCVVLCDLSKALYCIVLYCIMRPYTDGPIGPLSYRHSSGVVRNPHSTLAE